MEGVAEFLGAELRLGVARACSNEHTVPMNQSEVPGGRGAEVGS